VISDGDTAGERLNAFVQLDSGFDIAEEDLRLRGPGDLWGARQHGVPQLRIGDLIKDLSILEASRREAFDLIDRDPFLAKKEHQGVLNEVRRRFQQVLTAV